MTLKYRALLVALLASGVVIAGAAGFLFSGWYNMAADTPHTRPVYWLLTMLRERSVASHASGIKAPPLNDPALIRSGAGNYASMCAGCHLAPGVTDSELNRGLYPAPPRLANPGRQRSAVTDFWIIKHGIKASGMPAWGKSMEDRYIWGMVAFLETLPQLTPGQYRELVAASDGHQHGGGETMTHSMTKPATHEAHPHHDDSHSRPHSH